jgi:hypothetical protein
MGRIGAAFKRIGGKIKHAAKWANEKILQPVATVASNPITGFILNAVKPGLGDVVQGVGHTVKAINDRSAMSGIQGAYHLGRGAYKWGDAYND